MNERIRGVLAPVVTPFKPDLSPDPERLIGHCKWLLSQKCGLAVFGTNSEANSMSAEERMTLLDALVAAGVDPARMMPGTGCCSISETVELTAHAVKHGCAGVLMLPPFYYKNVSEEGLYRYFSEVVQRVGDPGLRIYLYHIPPVAVVGITPKLVERLLQAYPIAIAGMKDSSGDWNNTKTFLDAFAETARPWLAPSTCLWGANRSCWPTCATAGGHHFRDGQCEPGGYSRALRGVIIDKIIAAFVSNAEPEKGAWHKRLYKDLTTLQARLNVVREVFARKSWPSMIAALKQAIAIYGNDPEWARVRPPLVELTTEQARKLAAELEKIEFIINLVES